MTNPRYSVSCIDVNFKFSGCAKKSNLKSKFDAAKTTSQDSLNMSQQINISSRQFNTFWPNFRNVNKTSFIIFVKIYEADVRSLTKDAYLEHFL